MEHIVVKSGSLDEDEPIVFVKNERIWDDNKQPCPHCHSPIKVINTRSDLSTWDSIYWTNPYTALIPYDGSCCHTSICIKCLLDAVLKNNIDIDSIKEQVIIDFEGIPVFTEIRTELLKKDGWIGHDGCIWTKNNSRLAYEHNKQNNLSWNLNGKEVEFMEELNQLTLTK